MVADLTTDGRKDKEIIISEAFVKFWICGETSYVPTADFKAVSTACANCMTDSDQSGLCAVEGKSIVVPWITIGIDIRKIP